MRPVFQREGRPADADVQRARADRSLLMEPQLWFMAFAGLVHMQHHPGAGTRGHEPLSLERCAELADAMLILFSDRFKEDLCPSGTRFTREP